MDRGYHSSVIIGDELYTWGDQTGLPRVHDSPEKRQFTSSVGVFNIANSSFVNRQTTDTPPNGTLCYSCCSIGNNIYYFGGSCKLMDCYHDNLFTLNTITNDWREVITSNNDEGPIKKSNCGMIPFSINHEDYVLVIGGYGPLPSHLPSHAQYFLDRYNSPRCFTNEVHIMCVSTTPGNWSVPVITGSVIPPLSQFSINTLPGNRAIIFGGQSIFKNSSFYYSNDVFILSYTNNSFDFVKVAPTTIHWPKGRCDHSSVVISSVYDNGVKNHYLVVLGGRSGDGTTKDCYIMNLNSKKWKQISLPEVVVQRHDHSMSCYEISVNCVWLIVTGGKIGIFNFISSPNRLMVVELVCSPTNDEWTVTNVMNEDNMKSLQILSDRLSRKWSASTVTPSEEIIKDYEEQKQMIAKLQSDLQLCKVKLKEKDEEIKRYKADHLQEDTDVNYCEVFKDHYDSLVTAMATSCLLLSNVARALRSVKLVSQDNVDDVLTATRPQQMKQSVINLLNEIRNFLDITKKHPNKQKKILMDFCKALQTQDSPMLQFISTEILETLGVK